MIHAFSDDEVEGLTKYFPKKHIKDYGCEEKPKEIYDPYKELK